MNESTNNTQQTAVQRMYHFNPLLVSHPILITHDELLDLSVYGIRAFLSGFIGLDTNEGSHWYYVTDVGYEEALRTISSVHLKYSLKDMVKRLSASIFYNMSPSLNGMGRPVVSVKIAPLGEGLWTVSRNDMHFRDSSIYQDVVYHPEGELTHELIIQEIEVQLIKLQKRRIKLYKLWGKAKTHKGDLVVSLSNGRGLTMSANDICYAVGMVNGERRVYQSEIQLLDDLKWYL